MIEIIFVDALLMNNGEVILNGKTIGWNPVVNKDALGNVRIGNGDDKGGYRIMHL